MKGQGWTQPEKVYKMKKKNALWKGKVGPPQNHFLNCLILGVHLSPFIVGKCKGHIYIYIYDMDDQMGNPNEFLDNLKIHGIPRLEIPNSTWDRLAMLEEVDFR